MDFLSFSGQILMETFRWDVSNAALQSYCVINVVIFHNGTKHGLHITLDTSHCEISPLNAQCSNMLRMLLTFETSHLEMSH